MALGRNHKIFNIGNSSGTIQGLTRVYHDLTLSGDGTLSSLLGVVGGQDDEEVNQYVYDNSATIDEVNTSYQTNSGTFLTAIPDYYATTGDINDLAQSISENYQVKGDYVERNSMASAIESATSGKLDASSFASVSSDFLVASSLNGYATESFVEETSGAITSLIPTNYYPDTNPSAFVNEDWVTAQGYITGVDLTPYQTKSGMTAYATTGDVANKLDTTSFSNVSGTFLTAVSIPESADWSETTDVVKTNSGNWQDITAYQNASAGYLTAHQSLDGYATQDWVTAQGYITGVNISESATWNETSTTVQTNSSNWDNVSNKLDTTSFSNVSGTFLTAHQDLSNYYTKNETSGKEELANAFANIPVGDAEVNNYVHDTSATIDEVSTTVQTNSASWGQGGGVTYSAGEYIDITDDTISVTGVTDLIAGNAITITTSGTSAIISSNGEAQVQSDWNVTDSNSKAYIKNKPTIPAAQIQSDWNQTNTYAKDYIKNKPSIPRYTGASGININSNIVSLDNPVGLVAGDNISITVSGTSAIVSAANGGGSTPTYDYTDNNLISAIDTSGLYATSAGTAASANHLNQDGTMGGNITQSKDTSTFYYMPTTSPWTTGVATGIFSPLQYATGACLAMNGTFKAYFKGNEWYVSNATAGQALRGETHQSRGVHISGATTDGYSFDLSINAVSGKNDTYNDYNWKLERGCVSGKGINGEWRYGPAEDTLLRSVSSNEVNTYVQNNSATIDDVNTTYQNASSTYITAINIPESADWNDTTNVVQTNSSNWNDISAYQTISGTYLQGVSSDSTLSGDGTVNSPLGIVNPLPYPMEIVSTSSEATGTNILYVVTGAGA